RLLSHRLVVPLSAEAWDEARRRHPSGQGAWARLDARAALLAWPRRATRAQYVEHLQATIEGLGVPERLAEDVGGARQLELLVAALSGYAAGFEVQAEPQPQPTVDRALFIGELLDHLQLVSVRRDPEPGSGA